MMRRGSDHSRWTRAALAASLAVLPAARVGAEAIGIPECDDVLARYETCLALHAPAASRERLWVGARAMREDLRRAAADPAASGTLPRRCEAMRRDFARRISAFGCHF